jgi:hypothetical protein
MYTFVKNKYMIYTTLGLGEYINDIIAFSSHEIMCSSFKGIFSF